MINKDIHIHHNHIYEDQEVRQKHGEQMYKGSII